ncbi:MAG: STAS domain-containing protein [Casimicrobiaceae bacterium]
MELSSLRFADAVVAAPVGRIDHALAARLQPALAPMIEAASKSRGALVLDFSGVPYISSMGLRVLMIAAKELRAHGARIAVAAMQPVVAEIFDIARFGHVVDVFPSVPDALQALSPPALAAYEATAR